MSIKKKLTAIALTAALAVSLASPTAACCGVYVGSAVSENGSTYMGRSEDIGDMYGKIFGVAPSKEIAPGSVYEDTYGLVLEYDKIGYPSKTYSYTYVKDSTKYGETMKDENGNYIGEAYAEAGQNEKGLSMSATVSTSYNSKVKAADKLVWNGLCEISMTSLILGGCATAKEAVEMMGKIIDLYGSGECNSIMFSDPNETWYFEQVSGHQYAAVKMPADMCSVQPNIMLLGAIDVKDTENVFVSENLVKLAQDNGFLVTDDSGKIDVAKTYARENSGQGQYVRYCQGLFYLDPAAAEGIDSKALNSMSDTLQLYIKPESKLSTMEVLKLLACRGEGSAWDANAGMTTTAIGNNRQAECHIFETRQNMPDPMATIQWQAMADAEFSIYLPYYSAMVTEVHAAYDNDNTAKRVQGKYDYLDANLADSLNWNFQIINNLCYNNRATVADAVKTLFTNWQQSIIDQQELVDEEMKALYLYDSASAYEAANQLGFDLAQQVLDMTTVVKYELLDYINGDQSAPFTLSVADTLPVYTLNTDVDLDTGYNGPVMNWVKIPAVNNGVVTSGPLAASAGTTVTLYPKAADGFVLDSVNVVDMDGNQVQLNGMQFSIPLGGVTVNATFKLAR